MEHRSFVYGLFDPADAGHIRYVGMAPSRASRPYDHAKRASKDLTDCSHLMNWIRKIQSEGREPSVMILEQLSETTDRAFLGFVESCYVKSLRQIGHKLANENDGGWGGSNGPHSEESRARMRAGWTSEMRAYIGAIARERNLGKKHSEETRLKQSLAHQGRPLSEKNRLGIGASRKLAWNNATEEQRRQHALNISRAKTGAPGHLQSEESRAKISKTLTGRIMSAEWRAKNAAAQTGKKQSAETRAKRSVAIKAAWARRKKES